MADVIIYVETPEVVYDQYLGDSVYAGFDGYQTWIKTDNGLGASNEICLEPDVMVQLVAYNLRKQTERVNALSEPST